MKNNILFKFLAVFLCAASLLGIVGGAAGAFVLTEHDLYKKTVDEILEETFREDAAIFAEQTALSYASRELGGCPEDMARYRYGVIPHCDYGYSILDPEGNVLDSSNPELKETAKVYEIPVSGQYMHLVSTETESQRLAKETAARMDSISRGLDGSHEQTIPEGGILVNQVIFTNKEGAPIYEANGDWNSSHSIYYFGDDGNPQNSHSYEHGPRDQIGFLYYGPEGQITYRSFLEEVDHEFTSAEIGGVLFLSHAPSFLYQMENPDGLGTLIFENGCLRFIGSPMEAEIPAETVAETAPLETVPETLPEETAAMEEVPPAEEPVPAEEPAPVEEPVPVEEPAPAEEFVEETVSSSASAVPEETAVEETAPPETLPPETAPPETAPPETLPTETLPPETIPPETLPVITEPVLINGQPLEFYQVNRTEFQNSATGEHTVAKYVYLTLPEMTVEVYLDQDTMHNAAFYDVLRLVRQYRNYLLPAIGICLLVFAVTIVYLCTAAGRTPKNSEICAGGLNRLPLDLYLLLGILVSIGAIALEVEGVPILLGSDFMLGCSAAAGAGFVLCLLAVAYLFALIAQCKTSGGFWWRNLLCIRFVFFCMKALQLLDRWLRSKGLPSLGRLLKNLWDWTVSCIVWLYRLWEKLAKWVITILGRFFRWSGKKMDRFIALIPVTWQWLLLGSLMIVLIFATEGHWLSFVFGLCLVLYGAHCFGLLLESTRKMGRGELNTKVDDTLMAGCFKEFAGDLNALADVAVVAARKQLKSERMKTELITNVSHDIKTPLTSIINYVDLLQKPHTEEEGAQYLEVLDRQSQRLKKLVEDLMDMSKASTGNMTVEITRVDAVESVNQALGEFADKLDRARLTPVFHHSESSVPMLADGKLVWRVLSNLLGNAVKYAMPGTRLYLDLTSVDDSVIISLKNISKEALNVDAEELMERFVRGDVSRNTEGSGLGLNIAKSLMELQNGQLQILVDGDLFKVTLIFPGIH